MTDVKATCTNRKDHDEIWLQPICADGSLSDRLWSQDADAFENCEECGAEPVRFVRAGIHEALLAEVERLTDAKDEMWKAYCGADKEMRELRAENADLRRQITELQKIVQYCSEEHDAGRHDGLPEPCPAHDAIAMWLKAREYLNTQEPQS